MIHTLTTMTATQRCAAIGMLLLAVARPSRADDFAAGVASGDVTGTSAVLWTRTARATELELQIGTDDAFVNPVRRFDVVTSAERDFTAQLDVADLSPDTGYFYRFLDIDQAGRSSPIGRFRTAPREDAAAPLRFVFSGDSNFEHAPMLAMGQAAHEDADLFIWFGDTIYGDVTAGGLGPAVSLKDYRAKYLQMRGDENVRALLARMSVIASWDDHEVFNDYAGADPAVDPVRKQAGYQAFFEYMPIRPSGVSTDGYRVYRRIRYGANVEIFVLDGRQYREPSVLEDCDGNLDPYGFTLGPIFGDRDCITKLKAPRTMLGAAQFAWLTEGLRSSTAAVKIVCNPLPMTFIGVYPYDRWDGYDAERKALLEFIDANSIEGVVLLATDIHANGYNPDVTRYFRNKRSDYRLPNRIAVPELIVGPIGNETALQTVEAVEKLVALGIDKVKSANGIPFVDANRVSYLVVEVSESGEVHFEYKGFRPDTTPDTKTTADTFYSNDLGAKPPASCGLLGPGFFGAAAAPFVLRAARRSVGRR